MLTSTRGRTSTSRPSNLPIFSYAATSPRSRDGRPGWGIWIAIVLSILRDAPIFFLNLSTSWIENPNLNIGQEGDVVSDDKADSAEAIGVGQLCDGGSVRLEQGRLNLELSIPLIINL